MTLGVIRRRPTLPGRFQPSTISVLRLNFCVRDGNRWIPQAIVTGNQTGFGAFRCRLPLSVASAFERPPDFLFRRSLPLWISILCFRSQLQALTHCVSHPQNRTGWKFSSTRPRCPTLPRILSQTISSVSLRLSLSVPFPPLSLWFVLLLPTPFSLLPALQDQALDRLVSSSSIHYCTSTDDLSTLSSSRGLTCF